MHKLCFYVPESHLEAVKSAYATTPAGRLQLHVLGAIAEFERARIAERVKAGLTRAKANGKRLGRPRARIPVERLAEVRGLSHAEAAESLGVDL